VAGEVTAAASGRFRVLAREDEAVRLGVVIALVS
jgi:hypothetical protein